jgi:hypothetical protein
MGEIVKGNLKLECGWCTPCWGVNKVILNWQKPLWGGVRKQWGDLVETTNVGCNTQVHGSNTRNQACSCLYLKLAKNDVSFLLSLTFSLQQNQRREWGRFCPEVVGGEGEEVA